MKVLVVLPFRPSSPEREAALAWVTERWRRAGHEPRVGEPPAGPWCKGLAVQAALDGADGDVVVVADADVWCDGVEAAIAHVTNHGGWAIPHWYVHRLDEPSTAAVLAGSPLGGMLAEPRRVGYPGGGITVIERGLLDTAPIDPRFVGWGQEDQAAAAAWQTLGGTPWRGEADLWHLWHPPQPRMNRRVGSAGSQRLWRRYQAAMRKPDAMAALVAEAREMTDGRLSATALPAPGAAGASVQVLHELSRRSRPR